MDSSARSGVGGLTPYSNPRAWIVAGVAVAGVIVLAEAARRRRRWLRGKPATPPADFGAFCDSLELAPPPQAPPPAARQLLSDLTFAVSDNFEIEGYVAGFGNPDWKRTHTAASRTAVAVTNLLKQGATCVGRTVMDELGFGVTGENLHCGTPINPASPSVVPGGSCSGSAVAVSAQLVDFALGTDTTGDLRIPASFCGVLCFRPSHGIVSTLGTLANSQSLDTIGWLARDPLVLHRVGDVLLPAAAGGLKGKRQLVFADDCFESLKIPNHKTMHVIESAVQTLPGYQPPKHINIGHYIISNVPSLKEFCEPSTKLQEGNSALKALCTVMLLLQRYEFKANHEDWVNTVKPKLGLEITTRVLQAVNSRDDNIKSLYIVRSEWRSALKNLLKDTGILVLPTMAGYPLKRNSKQRLSSEFEDKMYAFVSIAALSGCCQATVPLGNHNDYPISLSFVATHGSDKFLLRAISDMYSTIQEHVVSASKLAPPPVIKCDVDASELLKEKGNNSFKRKQWSKAIEFYSEAIELNGTNATYYCNRAAAYLELGRFKQAEADCDQALLLDKRNVKAYLRRGAAKEGVLNHQEALQDFRHALALEPQNKAALAAERRIQKHLSERLRLLHGAPRITLVFRGNRSNGDAAAAATAPAPDAHGPTPVPHRKLPLGLLAVLDRRARRSHLHDPPPAAPRGRGARALRAAPARAARHAGLHLRLLRLPLRALSSSSAASPLSRALPAAAAAVRGPAGVVRRVHQRGPRARARALGGVPPPRRLPQVRARAGPRRAPPRRRRRRRQREQRAGRRRQPRRAVGGVRAHAAAAGGVGGRRGLARGGAGRARGADGDAAVEADCCRRPAGRRGVRRARGREARRRAAVARAEDGRVRRGARCRRAVRRRPAPRQPRARRRAHAPGRAASASSVPVQARQHGGVRAALRGQRRRRQGRGGGAADGDAAVVAAAAVPRQHRHGRAGAERQGEGGDGGRPGGADREAAVGAAGGGPGAVAAPLRRMPRHRLAQPRALLHALVRRVVQAPRVSQQQQHVGVGAFLGAAQVCTVIQ